MSTPLSEVNCSTSRGSMPEAVQNKTTRQRSGVSGAMFSVVAGLFVILAISVQFLRETFGKPLQEDDDAVHGH